MIFKKKNAKPESTENQEESTVPQEGTEEASSQEKVSRASQEGKAHHVVRRILLILIAAVILGLAGTQLAYKIFGLESLAKPANAVATLLTPVQTGFSAVVDWAVDLLYKLKLRSRLELEYNNLKTENEELAYQVMLVEELEYKLSVYENLFDEVSANESMNPLVATVIGRESGNYFSVFTINKGSNDGVQDYMAVTMDGALVGYTYNVTATESTVRTIIDSDASIAGLISSSRDQGTVRGTLDVDGTAMCRMYYLPETTLPRPGDLVVTSGVGMSFPKGIPIGTVRESTRGMESNKQYIVVEPQADFQHIEYVIVLRYQPTAVEVESRASSNDSITITPLETVVPVPTIQIGSEFYQLAPTPVPTATPTPIITTGPNGEIITITPEPDSGEEESYEYKVPTSSTTPDAYGFTPAPTPTPTPTPPPLDLSVEDD